MFTSVLNFKIVNGRAIKCFPGHCTITSCLHFSASHITVFPVVYFVPIFTVNIEESCFVVRSITISAILFSINKICNEKWKCSKRLEEESIDIVYIFISTKKVKNLTRSLGAIDNDDQCNKNKSLHVLSKWYQTFV